MSNKKNIWKNPSVKYVGILLIGLFIGWVIFGGTNGHTHELTSEQDQENSVIYTCSMHPQIRQNTPGKCPLCGMDLTPLKSTDSGEDHLDDSAIVMSKSAVALANIQTSRVTTENPVKDIELYGSIQVDERQQHSQSAHVSGRIEKLYVNFTGETVKQGQLLATIYSAELLTAQQELLEALKLQDFQPLLLQAAKERLQYYKMTPSQIQKVIDTKKASALVNIYSNTQGTVISKNVDQGDYVEQGSILYNIANLQTLWAVFDAYEQDLPFLKVNDVVSYTLQSTPGEVYNGKISFINPILDAQSRTAKVRVETQNKNQQLMPQMYAKAIIQAPLKNSTNEIVIPKSAVLWTGKRSLVYIKIPNTTTPAFQVRQVTLGPSLGNSYVILQGLTPGEEIVTNGVFVLDASAQLEGKNSMINSDNQTTENPTYTHSLLVNGNCEMCKDRIQKAANNIPGVLLSSWDSSTKILDLKLDTTKTSLQQVSKQVAKVGHQTQFDNVNEKDYQNLAACCKYDRDSFSKLVGEKQSNSLKLWVNGNCEMCQQRIQQAALALPGVKTALWDVKTKELSLEIDPKKVTLDKISQSIANKGHQTQLHNPQDKVYQELPSCCKYTLSESKATTHKTSDNLTSLVVKGNCEMCKDRIQKAATTLKGVKSAHWDIASNLLTVDIDPKLVTLAQISKVIAESGHDTALDKASNASYMSLHTCCKYTRES
ncbi:efflux RND transporter periplasmic adaptor subunit [Myroides sp. LJL119]